MKAHRVWTLILVAGLSACISDNPAGVAHVEIIDGVVINRVDDLGLVMVQRMMVTEADLTCEFIRFEDFVPGSRHDPASLSILGASVEIDIAAFTDNADDCGTGDVVMFDTSVPSSIDPDLVLAGQSVNPNLRIVAAHQSCENTEPDDADIVGTMRFNFPTGDWVIKSFAALDQEGLSESEQIQLETDGTFVKATDITVDNNDAVEVVLIDVDGSFSDSLDFEFNGSGAIDDIEICKIVERGGEGCTPGYWKQEQHFGNWPVDPFTFTFGEAFDGFCDPGSVLLRRPEAANTDVCTLTLLEALNVRGGGQNALARHAAAAWLNAGSTVDFFYSQSEVETKVEAALALSDFESVKNELAEANEAGCPLGRAELP